jgi:multiple sugar transport system permease protein
MTDLLDRMRADDADEHIDAAADGRDARSAGSSTTRARIRGVIKHVLLISAALLMLYPVIWMVVSSLRPTEVIFREPGLILTDLELDNYVNGWFAFEYPFSTALFNSTVIVIFSIIGNLVSCSMAAYAFARVEFIGRRVWFAIMLLTIMLPIHVIIVPQYIMFSEIGWTNTFLPLIVPKFLATDAFFIFLMVQFIRGIPRELDEAARIDGAGHVRIFGQVMLPLMVPALATTAIFTFIWTWNDFFVQLIFLTKPALYTVPLYLRGFMDSQSSTNFGEMFAMSVLSLIPIFLIFLFGQRFLIAGIATTGGK